MPVTASQRRAQQAAKVRQDWKAKHEPVSELVKEKTPPTGPAKKTRK